MFKFIIDKNFLVSFLIGSHASQSDAMFEITCQLKWILTWKCLNNPIPKYTADIFLPRSHPSGWGMGFILEIQGLTNMQPLHFHTECNNRIIMNYDIDGLVQERCNSIANALELTSFLH